MLSFQDLVWQIKSGKPANMQGSAKKTPKKNPKKPRKKAGLYAIHWHIIKLVCSPNWCEQITRDR